MREESLIIFPSLGTHSGERGTMSLIRELVLEVCVALAAFQCVSCPAEALSHRKNVENRNGRLVGSAPAVQDREELLLDPLVGHDDLRQRTPEQLVLKTPTTMKCQLYTGDDSGQLASLHVLGSSS
jgi:hypothetical protein